MNLQNRYTYLFLITLLASKPTIAKLQDDVPTISSSLEATRMAKCGAPIGRDVPYLDALRVAIERCFVFPPYLEDGARCEVRVSQTPQGSVTRVKIQNCKGHPKFADFIERAVLKASPLPRPAADSSFLPTFGIVFSPNVEKFRKELRTSSLAIQELSIIAAPCQSQVNDHEAQNYKEKSNDTQSVATPGKRSESFETSTNFQSNVLRYLKAWKSAVEKIGNRNYPDEARGKVYGSAVVSVGIQADGTVTSVEIERSSGHQVLDDAIRRIVLLGSPYAPFSPELTHEVDVLELTQTWIFDQRIKMECKRDGEVERHGTDILIVR